jgi:TonB family protein
MRTLKFIAALAALTALAAPAQADLYAARKAVADKDFAGAFTQFLELARLGQVEAQENVAIAYVNGEGVARDNILGLAWAEIAAENGSPNVQNIIEQLKPHVTPKAQQRIDAVYAEASPAALNKRLLPVVKPPGKQPLAETGCAFAKPANPDDYYPQGGIKDSISGNVIVDFTVQPDGRAHSAHVVQATTPVLFDEAARAVVMNSTFTVKHENGVAVPCDMRIKVKFVSFGRVDAPAIPRDIEEKLPATRKLAEGGDPQAQLLYVLVLLKYPEIKSDDVPTMPWTLSAAQAGLADAQYQVGTCALHGMSVEKDAVKGAAWLALAAKAGHPLAQVSLADYLVTSRTDSSLDAEVLALLEGAVKSGYYGARYQLAALLATASNASLRDPRRALALISDVMPVVNYDPAPHEVRAAAYAWLGDFDAAAREQKVALARASKLGWDSTPLEARLALYKAGKTWTGNLLQY